MPVKVNQKWLFWGLGLDTWEIKYHFWVRNRNFQTSILFPVFNSKLQVWFSFSLINLNLILILLDSVFTSQQLQSAEKSSNPDFEADFYLGTNPRKILGFKPKIPNLKRLFLVYFNRPFATFRSLPILV